MRTAFAIRLRFNETPFAPSPYWEFHTYRGLPHGHIVWLWFRFDWEVWRKRRG